jgi:hypothetical protein
LLICDISYYLKFYRFIKNKMSSQSTRRDIENKEYLVKNVNHILEPLMLEVVASKPEN